MRARPTLEEYKKTLRYDPETGNFYWTYLKFFPHRVGTVAGTVDCKGYLRINALNDVVAAHRLAFLFMLGRWPTDEVDHIDQDRLNNKWSNLREIDRVSNQQNVRRANSNNKTGFLGVTLSQNKKRYWARIKADGRTMHLGSFDTPEKAHEAYVIAKRKYHKGCTL